MACVLAAGGMLQEPCGDEEAPRVLQRTGRGVRVAMHEPVWQHMLVRCSVYFGDSLHMYPRRVGMSTWTCG